MPDPAYISGSFKFPGQPALTPSPMEDAFRVLAAYSGGVAQKATKEKEDFMDILKAGINAGFVEPDLTGGVSGGVKYNVIPKDQRPEYIKAMAAARSADAAMLNAEAWMPQATASAPKLTIGEQVGRFTNALFGGSKTNTQSTLDGLAVQIRNNPFHAQELKASYKNPEYRERLKKLLIQKYAVRADTADSAIDALVSQVEDAG